MADQHSPRFQVDLTGHAALVTGAGAGVGLATALALARSGAAVVTNDLNPDRAERAAALITEGGGLAVGWQADVANRFQVGSMIEAARDRFGRVDLLVNAAGVYKAGSMSRLDEWDWRRALDVNLTGAFFCTQLLTRVMADEGGGAVVSIGSTAGLAATLADGIGYAASKAGLVGLTRQAARELAPSGIRVNAVCAANIAGEDETRGEPRNMQARLGSAEDVAGAALFLLSGAAAFITGQVLVVDGGGLLA